MLKYTNKFGKVGFDASVFAAIAADTAVGFGGRMIFTNSKGRPVKAGTSGYEKLNFINVSENKNNNTVNVEIFLILKFGTSISWFTKEFARRLRIESEEITGIVIDKVVINITGIRSVRTAKREIRIVC